ncbi:hypothetical protein BT69DRAFT_597389 [Atractiella rhizophila]|nr:hypothetical protein BT69DRAFT_597389 [Atractiella rhizophila]
MTAQVKSSYLQMLLHLLPLRRRRSEEAGKAASLLLWSFGSDRWKLELLHPPTQPSIIPPSPTGTEFPMPLSQASSLSLYLTCHVLESDYYPWSDFSIPVVIMVGVKAPSSSNAGVGGRIKDWVWREWETDWFFARENEVWECHTFPSLKELLKNVAIRDSDSFTLSIQIQSPVERVIPQLKGHHHVPRDLLTGIESLLDDPHTGDVRILLHERQPASIVFPMNTHAQSRDGGDDGAYAYRRRSLFAHSALLRARSEYFRAMLSGDWREGLNGEDSGVDVEEGGKGFCVVIEDFDFPTVYWLLHWIYTNDISLLSTEDIRSSASPHLSTYTPPSLRGMLSDSSSRPLAWEWQYLPSSEADTASSHHSDELERSTRSTSRLSSHSVSSPTTRTATRLQPSGTAKPAFGTSIPPTVPPVPVTPITATGRRQTSTASTGKRRPTSSNVGARLDLALGGGGADPHPHPCPCPSAASAFSMYRLAHRYQIPDLEALALKHLVENLTPATAFPLLLATHPWPELHGAIKGYALSNYYAIVAEPEFRRCYAEVGEGLWENGGQVLLEFTLALAPVGGEN